MALSACGLSESGEQGAEAVDEEPEDVTQVADLWSLFIEGSLVGEVETVDCTLENGSESSCYQLTTGSQPDSVETGPFCPDSVDDPEYGTFVWDGEEPGLYGLDEQFWEMLAAHGYSFANADGSVNVADPGEAGTRPTDGDVCLQATPDDSYTLQVLIPVEPEILDAPTELGTVSQVGIATDGVTIFGDAPSGTTGAIPALDHCGGHDDPTGYYHWHFGSSSVQANLDAAGVDAECSVPQEDEALMGIAYDGFPIYGPLEDGSEPTDLDACNGHVGQTSDFGETYHYHLSFDSPNLPTCRAGATGNGKLSSPDNPNVQLPDPGGPGGVNGGPPPDDGSGPPPGTIGGPPPPPGADSDVALPSVAEGGSEEASQGEHCHTVDGEGQPVCH